MATLTTLRANLRNDLKDLDSTDYAWTDDELDRHILRAAGEYEGSWPKIGQVTKNGTGSARRFDISSSGFINCERVEYEIDQNPVEYLPFLEETPGIVRILGDRVPASGTNNVKFWYASSYTVTTTTSEIPSEHESGVLAGAWAFGVQAFARYAERRVNVRNDVAEGLREASSDALKEFRDWLGDLRTARANVTWPVSWNNPDAARA